MPWTRPCSWQQGWELQLPVEGPASRCQSGFVAEEYTCAHSNTLIQNCHVATFLTSRNRNNQHKKRKNPHNVVTYIDIFQQIKFISIAVEIVENFLMKDKRSSIVAVRHERAVRVGHHLLGKVCSANRDTLCTQQDQARQNFWSTSQSTWNSMGQGGQTLD